LGLGAKSGYDPDLRDGALRDALTKAMVNMMKQLGKRKWNGRIAKVSGNNLYINAGQKSGLNIGDRLDVYRAGESIIDPETHQKLGTMEDLIGGAVVIKNDLGDQMDLSVAQSSSGSNFRTGDIVKLSSK
jgi:hypothetical protein